MAARPPRKFVHAIPGPLPPDLRVRMASFLPDEVEALEAELALTPPVSLRLNPAKPTTIQGEPVPWCNAGRYLDHRPLFTLDPALHAGAYYVQEASSMLLEQAVLGADLGHEPVVALDLCAAPGGKSTHLAALLPEGSLLVANEVVPKRRAILRENLWKWGASNVAITGSAPQEFERLPDFFDVILVDAPCSGEGMFRKDPFAREQWSTALVEQCAVLQRDILKYAWSTLRPGGTLIYSTCTWEHSENEEQLERLLALGGEAVRLPAEQGWGVSQSAPDQFPGLRCYPHRVRGEGFFIGLVRKPSGERSIQPPLTMPGANPPAEVATWLRLPMAVIDQENVLYAIGPEHCNALHDLRINLRVDAPGIPIAERKGNSWRPHPALALSPILRPGAFDHLVLDRAQALDYLRGNAIRSSDARGTALAVYEGLPLGWLHGAGNRWNNGWPAAWRIRMGPPA